MRIPPPAGAAFRVQLPNGVVVEIPGHADAARVSLNFESIRESTCCFSE